ncbi:hypothetical protein [Nonomuraea sp. NPDC002799]
MTIADFGLALDGDHLEGLRVEPQRHPLVGRRQADAQQFARQADASRANKGEVLRRFSAATWTQDRLRARMTLRPPTRRRGLLGVGKEPMTLPTSASSPHQRPKPPCTAAWPMVLNSIDIPLADPRATLAPNTAGGAMGRVAWITAAEALATATSKVAPHQFPELLAAYDELLRAQPDQPWRHAEHADAMYRVGRPEDALIAYDHAITLDPDNASLHFNKGHLLFGLARFEEAASELVVVTRLRPNDVLGAKVLLGAIAWPTNTDKATGHFADALSSPGEQLTSFTRTFYQALALAGLGRTEEALSELERGLPTRSADEMTLDHSDRLLLGRFRDPPLSGLDALCELLES